MLSGLLLSTLLLSPGQPEEAPPPAKLPKLAEGERPQGSIPKAAEVALPPVTSGCASCSTAPASYPAGCASGSCYGAVCDNPGPVGPPDKGWSDQSFLYLWYKPAPLPTLLATRVNGQSVRLHGGDAVFDRASGGRVSAGLWVNEPHTFGYGWSAFLMEQRADFFTAASNNGSPELFRPFTDSLTNTPAELTVARPGEYNGSFAIESGARLAGGELYAMQSVHYDCQKSFVLLAGFRYWDLDEYLAIYQQTEALPGAAPLTVGGQPATGAVNLTDRFRTRNQFYGMQIGGRGDLTWKCLSFGLVAKVGLGNIHQTLDIAGETKSPDTNGGFLALPTNIGKANSNRFGAMAETSAEVGINVTKGSRLILAYDFMYLNDVLRPGSQVDAVINVRQVPVSATFNTQSGAIGPAHTRKSDDFFAYGVRFGYQIKY